MNISQPAAPSVTQGEASCPGFAQPDCDLMPVPSLFPIGCSGSEGEENMNQSRKVLYIYQVMITLKEKGFVETRRCN